MAEAVPVKAKEQSHNYAELFNAEEDDGFRPKRSTSSFTGSEDSAASSNIFNRLRSRVEINRTLLVSKVFYFFYFAAIGSLSPYMALYYKHSLLLPAHLVGIVLSVKPFCLFLSAPVVGTIVDKYNKVKVVLGVALATYIVSTLLITVVPPVTVSCLSEVNQKLNISNHLNASLHGNTTHHIGRLKAHQLKHELSKHKQPKPVQELENRAMWEEAWLFDLYRKIDAQSYEKAKTVFIVVLVITVFRELIGATSNTLADIATFQTLGNKPHEYGEQRLWGTVGWGFMAFITGSIVSHQYKHQSDICPEKLWDIYRPFFYVYCVLMAIALFVSTRFKFQQKEENGTADTEQCAIFQGLGIYFTNWEYFIFVLIAFFTGACHGSAESFLYFHLAELDASPALFSALVGAECLSVVTIYYASVYLIKKYGELKMVCAGMLVYALRFYYFSVVEEAWLVLPIEFLRGFCTALTWSGLAAFVGCPPHVGATLQGILHGIYYGLGKGIGQLLGGILIRIYGFDKFFRYFSLIDFLVLLVFAVLIAFINRKGSIWMRVSGYMRLESGNKGAGQDERFKWTRVFSQKRR